METTLPVAVIASAFVGLIGLFFGWLFGRARNNNYTQALMNKIEALKTELKDSGEFFNHEIAVLNKELDRRQHIIDAYKIGESSVSRFLKVAEDLIDEHPYLYVELARTRATDWMTWLRKNPHSDLIASGGGLTAEDACRDIILKLESDVTDLESGEKHATNS